NGRYELRRAVGSEVVPCKNPPLWDQVESYSTGAPDPNQSKRRACRVQQNCSERWVKPDASAPRLSRARLFGGLKCARSAVPFICELAVGGHALDAQPREFILVVRPREQQGSPRDPPLGGAQEELPRN